jgi:hypothetical protein
MKYLGFSLISFLFLAAFASPTLAGTAARTWVSAANGKDTNPCTVNQPCQSFNHALGQTPAGGEVVALDSGDYAPFSVTEAVTVSAAPGAYVGITVTSGDGVDVSAGSSDRVVLRGLRLNSFGSSGDGVNFLSGGALHVEDCAVYGFGNGLNFGAPGELEVHDSSFQDNGGGILIIPGSGAASALIDGIRVQYTSGPYIDTVGLQAWDYSTVTVKNSLFSGYGFGLIVSTDFLDPTVLNIENCVVSNNLYGVFAAGEGGQVTITVSNSMVVNNGEGIYSMGELRGPQGGVVILSRTNNTVQGNGEDEYGVTGTYPAR